MARVDYRELITEIVQPRLVENIVYKEMSKLDAWFGRNTDVRGGQTITDANTLTTTAAGGAFTRVDADPVSYTATFDNAYWNKLYYHESFTVRREDISEKKDPSATVDLLSDAAGTATKLLMEHAFDGIWTQIKADVDSNNTYSTAALTRGTPLASYEEATDATITLAYLRGAQNALALRDGNINWGDYMWILEQTVMNTAHPLMSATGSWVENNPRMGGNSLNVGNQGQVASGYMPVASFDGIPIDSTHGMTVGDCYLLKREDVQIQEHFPLEIEMKEVDEFAMRGVVRIGINAWVRRPRYQAKLTSKD